MKNATTILDALARRGVTQKQIADAIGITQPNANKLYRPDRNGKLRTLSYDEGRELIDRFGLANDLAADDHAAFNAATLAPILDALLPLVPSTGRSERSSNSCLKLLHMVSRFLVRRQPGRPAPMRSAWPLAEQSLDFARSAKHDHPRHRTVEETGHAAAGAFRIGQFDSPQLSLRINVLILFQLCGRKSPTLK